MAKHRAPQVGHPVQFVTSTDKGVIVSAAVIVGIHSESVVNLKVFADVGGADRHQMMVHSQAEAARLNAKGVGFPVHEFWRFIA